MGGDRKRATSKVLVGCIAALALFAVGLMAGSQLNRDTESTEADSAGTESPERNDSAPSTPTTRVDGDDAPESVATDATAPVVADDVPLPTDGPAVQAATSGHFVETFDGSPDAPTPWNGADWDISVHSRAVNTFEVLDEVQAQHGPDCGPPTETHPVSDYRASVFQCRDHVMTALFGENYSMAYLTPNAMADFSEGEAVIRFDISTLRTSARDWWDVWITPYDDHLQLPLELQVDAQGVPRDSIRVGLGVQNQVKAVLYEDFQPVDFGTFPNLEITPLTLAGYESFLEPDAARRDTFEIRLSKDHIKVGMPEYDFWWVDSELPELDWTSGVVQFGHHSYNPLKDCNRVNNPIPPVDECSPMTWHWDNVSIEPAVGFTIIDAEQRVAVEERARMDLVEPIPDDARLRFSGLGTNFRVRFDDGEWVDAVPQPSSGPTSEGRFFSYFIDAPAGATTVEFDADPWFGGRDWHVRDVSTWATTA